MISCVILWRKHFDTDIELTELVACFSLKEVNKNKGVYYANSWNKILCNPVDAKVWKNNWFFVGGDWERPSDDEFTASRVNTTFRRVPSWLNPYRRLKKVSQDRFTTIRALSRVERSPKSLITEESLVAFGLAPALVVPSRSHKKSDRPAARVEVPGLTPEKRKASIPASSVHPSKSVKVGPTSSAPDAGRFSSDSPPSVRVKHCAPVHSKLGKGKASTGASDPGSKVSGEEETTVKVPTRVARLVSKAVGLMPTSASSSKMHIPDPLKHADETLGRMFHATNEVLRMRDQVEVLLRHSSKHQSECADAKGKVAVVEEQLETLVAQNGELRSEISRLKGGLEVAEKTCQELREARDNAERTYKESAAYKADVQRLLKEGFINCRTRVVAEIGDKIGLDFLFPDEEGKKPRMEVSPSPSETEETAEEEEEYLDEDEVDRAGTPSGSEQDDSSASPPAPAK